MCRGLTAIVATDDYIKYAKVARVKVGPRKIFRYAVTFWLSAGIAGYNFLFGQLSSLCLQMSVPLIWVAARICCLCLVFLVMSEQKSVLWVRHGEIAKFLC